MFQIGILPKVHDYRDKALACRPLQANVWLSQHTLVMKLNLKTNYFLKPHLNHPGQCLVTQACKIYSEMTICI